MPQTNEDLRKLVGEFKDSMLQRMGKIEGDIHDLREAVKRGEIEEGVANERIETLEKNFEILRRDVQNIMTELSRINVTITNFSPKLDRFMDNLWKVVFLLLVILAGLIGIKLW